MPASPTPAARPDPALPAGACDTPVAPSVEQRREARAGLTIMRAGKLVCQSGEYVCLIRDVSAGGIKLRLFHALPDETHVLLERGDGAIHALIRVWTRDNTAGFRFAEPVDPAEFLTRSGGPEARSIRLRAPAPALVYVGGSARGARLRNLSQGGAHVDFDGHLPIGEAVVLSVDRLGEQPGWVRWRRGQGHGIVFDVPRRLDQLAHDVLKLQPLPAGAPAARSGAIRGAA